MRELPFAISPGQRIADAFSFAFGMFWEILWALILGFALSGAVQAVVSKGQMRRLLPDDSPRSIALASALGTASSSCSYAAVALARCASVQRERVSVRADKHRKSPRSK